MKRNNIAQIIFEIISVLGNIIIGTTILTFIFRDETINKTFISFIILSIGAIEIVGFLALKDSAKIKNILNLVSNLALMALGIILFILNIKLDELCLIWGIVYLVLYSIKVTNYALRIPYQPLLCSIKIILSIILIIYSIILIVKRSLVIEASLTYIGVSLLIEAFILFIEFLIHRYQK
ncbi:MAG TPA: hypothetical protein GX010_03100 [Erysipelotrichaceae bacterium]|nr:hypothetical protein [Erysipelotrichaceae bacterium]